MNRLQILRSMIRIMEALVVTVVMVIEKCQRPTRKKVVATIRLLAERREQGKFLIRSDFMRDTAASRVDTTHPRREGCV